jgi:hypothetical protein
MGIVAADATIWRRVGWPGDWKLLSIRLSVISDSYQARDEANPS